MPYKNPLPGDQEERASATGTLKATPPADYLQLLRDSEAAFLKGDVRTGQRLLDAAASLEDQSDGEGRESGRTGRRLFRRRRR
jgi:hypothetical protein